MLSFRVVAAGVVLLLVSGMAAGRLAAQTATNESPGKPLQLLQIVSHPNKAKIKRHAKSVAHRKHRILVGRNRPQPPAQTAAAAPSEQSIWPTVNATTSAAVTASEPAPAPTAVPADPVPSERVVTSETVRMAAPNDADAADPAANAPHVQTADAAPGDTTGTTTNVQTNAAASVEVTQPPQQSNVPIAAPQHPRPGVVGSASWIAQVLAAFGGAVAAGSLAWFLIGPAPQRTFG